MAPSFGWNHKLLPNLLKIRLPETDNDFETRHQAGGAITSTPWVPIDYSGSSGLDLETFNKSPIGSPKYSPGAVYGASSSEGLFDSSEVSLATSLNSVSVESSIESSGSSANNYQPFDSFDASESSGSGSFESYLTTLGSARPPELTVLKSEDTNWLARMFPTDLIGNTLLEMVASSNTEHPEIPVAVVNKIDYGIRMNAATLIMNASTVNTTDFPFVPDLFYRHSLAMTAVYCVAYLLVFAVGLVGNCFVIAVVFRSPRMRTVTNFFIVNLAVADILVIIFCLPATLMSNIFVPWVLGWWMCKTVPYVQGVSVAASVYSLIAVSLDRFLAIWWPLKCQITKRRARLMIFIIWVIALTTTIPWALFFDLVVIFSDAPDIQLCLEVWPDSLNGALYFLIANLLFCYILPMILITMCYILIWIKVWKRHIPTDTKDAQMERMQQKSKIKVVKMLVAVVILFVVSWLPLYVIFARIKLGNEMEQWEDEILPIATPIAQWLGASNSCINPILYAFFNKKYRRGFMAIVKSRRCCGRLRYYETVAMMSSSTSMRKSSHYFNNNNSSSRRIPPDTAVSYIYNNTGV